VHVRTLALPVLVGARNSAAQQVTRVEAHRPTDPINRSLMGCAGATRKPLNAAHLMERPPYPVRYATVDWKVGEHRGRREEGSEWGSAGCTAHVVRGLATRERGEASRRWRTGGKEEGYGREPFRGTTVHRACGVWSVTGKVGNESRKE